MKNCLTCKKEFEAKRERAKFCSDLCRATWHQNEKQAKKNLGKLKAMDPQTMDDHARGLFKELMAYLGRPKNPWCSDVIPTEPAGCGPLPALETMEIKPPPGLKGIALRIWQEEQKTKP